MKKMNKQMTLCIVQQHDKVLLGMKKRGFGEGKWNGFGGKVAEGETVEDAAKRELFEEAGLTASAIEKLGVLDFSWEDKPDDILRVTIFKAVDFQGIPKESDEMVPQWFLVKDIPYEKMWPDDKHWMPLFLKDKKFKGKFMFDEDNNVLEYQLN